MEHKPGRLSFSRRPSPQCPCDDHKLHFNLIYQMFFPSIFPFLDKSRKYLAAKNTRFVTPGQQHASNMVPVVYFNLSKGIRSTFQRRQFLLRCQNNQSFQFQLMTSLARLGHYLNMVNMSRRPFQYYTHTTFY